MIIDAPLLQLSIPHKGLTPQALVLLKSIYHESVIEKYDTQQGNFERCKSQLMQLLDYIISLNESDFAIFKQYQQNVAELTKEHSPDNIKITLLSAKEMLESAVIFIQQTPQKIEKSHLDSFIVHGCLSGAFSNIAAITELYISTQLNEKICQAKNDMIKAVAIEYLQDNRLLLLEDGSELYGDEIHWTNGLVNSVACQYGLAETEDHLIPAEVYQHRASFAEKVKPRVSCFSIIEHIMITHPLPEEKCTYDAVVSFFQAIEIPGNTSPHLQYERLFSPPAMNDSDDDSSASDYKWVRKDNIEQRYAAFLIDLFQREQYIENYIITIDELRLVKLYNDCVILNQDGSVRHFGDDDTPYLIKNHPEMMTETKSTFQIYIQYLSFSGCLQLYQRTHLPCILETILKKPLTIDEQKIIACLLSELNQVHEKIFPLAVLFNHVEIVNALLTEPDTLRKLQLSYQLLPYTGATALSIATVNGNVKMIESLLKKGAIIDSPCTNGSTPLFFAVMKKNLEIVELLLQHNASVNQIFRNYQSSLSYAVTIGHIDLVRLLLNFGADVNQIAFAEHGETPLFLAATYGHVEILKALLDRGAAINQTASDGRTPLFVAAQLGFEEIVTTLLDRLLLIEEERNNSSQRFFQPNGITPGNMREFNCKVTTALLLDIAERQSKAEELKHLLLSRDTPPSLLPSVEPNAQLILFLSLNTQSDGFPRNSSHVH